MEQLFKKYFWALNLVAIGLIAWVTASTMTDWVAGKIFVVPKVQSEAGKGEDDGGTPRLGRVPGERGAAQLLASRNLFDLNATDEPGGKQEEEDKKDEEKEDGGPEGELAESKLPIDLLGTMVATDHASSSMATLSVEGENKIAWVGSEFLDGKAKIVTIGPRHVVVKEEGEYRVIKLWADRTAQAKPGRPVAGRPGYQRPGAAKPPPGRDRPVPARPQPAGRTDYRKGIKKTGAYSYQIERSMLDQSLADLEKLGSQARIVPNYRGGKYQGFKLVGVRPGSLYRALGVRSGDVIKSVNGRAIDSPNKALELFEQLKKQSSIALEIERRGQPKTIDYTID